MSLLTELYGVEVINESLEQVKARIKKLPPTLKERKSYLLKDYAKIKGISLSNRDFVEVSV